MRAPDSPAFAGETLHVLERVIVAPGAGSFRPGTLAAGAVLVAGDTIGTVDGPGTSTVVCSAFSGTLMGLLADPGERLRPGQPVAWLRVA